MEIININNRPLSYPGVHSAFGSTLTADLHSQFQNSFEYTVDNTDLTTNTVVGDGTVTQANAMAVITSSATTASSAKLISRSVARYRAGFGGNCRFTALFTAGVAATEQLAGLADEAGSSQAFKNGYMVGFIGDTFGVHRFSNDTVESITSFNLDPLDGTGKSKMTIDVAKINVFQIQYQYLGAGAIIFSVEDDDTGNFFEFHRIDYTNRNTEPSCFNPNFHFTLLVNNKATTSNLIAKCSSFGYYIEGKTHFTEIQQPQFSSNNLQKTSVTSEIAVFTIKNKSTYSSKTNFIDIVIENIAASIEASSANNLGNIRLVKNASLGGSPSFSDINATNSIVEIDTAATTVTGGRELLSVNVAGKNDRIFQNLVSYQFLICPGESMTLAVSSANSATIEGSMLWKELF